MATLARGRSAERQAGHQEHRHPALGRARAADPRRRYHRRGRRPHLAVGKAKDIDAEQADVVVDAKGTTVAPGLIDSHVHPVFGDWTPRQSQLGWIDSFLHGGVTTMISAGEVHLPGRPGTWSASRRSRSPPSARSRASARAASSARGRAGARTGHGRRLQGGRGRVKLLGEVGLGGVKQGEEAKRMVAWARKYGIQSTIHTGGPSIPGSGLIDADVVLEADADVIGHINGGHTALPVAQIRCLCEQCTRAIEVVHNGNALAALYATRTAIGSANRSGSSSAPIRPPARACSRSASCGRSRC